MPLVRNAQSDLEFHLRPELHYAIRGDPEKFGGGPGIAGHKNEKLLAPVRERLRSSRDQVFPAKVIRRLGWLGDDPALGGERKDLGHVRRLHEAVLGFDAPEVVRKG